MTSQLKDLQTKVGMRRLLYYMTKFKMASWCSVRYLSKRVQFVVNVLQLHY